MLLTVATAHVFRHTDGCDLDDLDHVCPVAPDLRASESLDDSCLAESSPAALRLCQVFEEPNDAMLHLDISFGLEQRGEIRRKRNWRLYDRCRMSVYWSQRKRGSELY